MIRSMTGYGRAALKDSADGSSGGNITVELRAVNHRYFDCSVRLPRLFLFLEDAVKTRLQKSIHRGKVEVFVSIEPGEEESVAVTLTKPLLEGYLRISQQLIREYGVKNDLTVTSLLRLPDVVRVVKNPVDTEAFTGVVLGVVDEAVAMFLRMREKEGANLAADMLARVDMLRTLTEQVEARAPKILEEYRARLLTRMQEVLGNVTLDETRILTEAALFADRVCVSEETVRLHSHLDQLSALLSSGEAVGRRLDFLIQELNREVNTIGSKSQDQDCARTVVEMKTEIEKIREQVQNIE